MTSAKRKPWKRLFLLVLLALPVMFLFGLRPARYQLGKTEEAISRARAVELLASGSYYPAFATGADPLGFFDHVLLFENPAPAAAVTEPRHRDWWHGLDRALAGRQLPPFEGTDMAGQPVQTEELRGKLLVLNFWFRSCGPCLNEIPGLNELVARTPAERATFVAFSLDSREHAAESLTRLPFSYRVVPDAKSYFDALGIVGAPVHMVVRPDGRIHRALTLLPPELATDVLERVMAEAAES